MTVPATQDHAGPGARRPGRACGWGPPSLPRLSCPPGLESLEPLKYTKLGGPKSWKLRKPPVLRAPPSGGLCGADPINICNPPPCSLLPKLLPSCLSQGPESVELVGVAPGFYGIYSNSCTYVKRSFLNICAFSLLPRLFVSPAQGQRGRRAGELCTYPPGGHLGVAAICRGWRHAV